MKGSMTKKGNLRLTKVEWQKQPNNQKHCLIVKSFMKRKLRSNNKIYLNKILLLKEIDIFSILIQKFYRVSFIFSKASH